MRTWVVCDAYLDRRSNQYLHYGGLCRTLTIVLALSHLILFTTFVLSDMWMRPAPLLRLYLVSILTVYLAIELYARHTSVIQVEEMEVHGIAQHVLTALGSSAADGMLLTTEDFIYKCDFVVIILMASSFTRTVLRPGVCAMTTLPARLDAMIFYFSSEWTNREINGKQRHFAFNDHYNHFKHRLHRLPCCKKAKMWEIQTGRGSSWISTQTESVSAESDAGVERSMA